MRVYIFQAALWCEDCIRSYLKDRDEVLLRWTDLYSGGGHLVSTEDMLRELLTENGCDPDNESTWDSDKFPKGPYENGGGEADSPQHCDQCCVFLENPLTYDGYNYVLEQLELYEKQKNDAAVDGSTYDEWRHYYGDDRFPAPRCGTTSINEYLNGEDA